MDVICPGCKRSYHETTSTYDGTVVARGDMVRLKDPWRKWGWSTFGDGLEPAIAETRRTLWSSMSCPMCNAPLAPGKRLTVKIDDERELRKLSASAYAEIKPQPLKKRGRPPVNK